MDVKKLNYKIMINDIFIFFIYSYLLKMIRINNNAPIIILLVLFIGMIIQKMGILGITLCAVIICIVALNWLGIVHTRQLINYGENFADFLLSNESPLNLKAKLDKFHDDIQEPTTDINKEKLINIPKDLIYNEIGVLAEYEELQNNINKFIDIIEDKTSLSPLDKDRMKRDIGIKISYIMYNAYVIINEPNYRGKNYQTCLESQKGLLNDIHSFIYLDLGEDSYHDDEMNKLLVKTIELNRKLNMFLIEKIGDNDTIPYDIDEPESFDINGLGTNEDGKFKRLNLSNNLYF